MVLSFSILRNRNFRILLLTRMLVTMALQAQAVIVGWQVYSLTHDPLMLGFTGLAEAVPAIGCALFAGHVVDITLPHRIYRYCLLALTLNTAMLLAVGGGYLPLASTPALTLIFTGIFFSGLARSFLMPANFALLSAVAPRQDIASASAWLSSGFQGAAILSPALAGLVYGGFGRRIAWMLPMLFVALAFAMVLALKPDYQGERIKRGPALTSILAGIAYLRSSPALLSMMALDMFAVLFGGAVAILPVYADQVLHVGSSGLGLLRAAPAVGAVIMALLLAVRPLRKATAVRLLWAVTGFGFAMIGFGLSKVFWLSILFLVASGGFDSVSMVIRQTLMQLLTPDDMRGRLSSINSIFIVSSNEIGAFESGTLAKLLGLVPSIVCGGILTLVVAGTTAIASPRFRRTVVVTDG